MGGIASDIVQNTAHARADTDAAYALILKGKHAEAEPLLIRALEYDPMYGPAHNDLGLVYYRRNRLYDAAWEFEKAAKLMPREPQPRNNLGLVLEGAGELKEAISAYEKAVELAPDSAEFIGNLARAKVRIGDTSEATQRLLQELILRDSRPDWADWARTQLLRIRGAARQETPTSIPSSSDPN